MASSGTDPGVDESDSAPANRRGVDAGGYFPWLHTAPSTPCPGAATFDRMWRRGDRPAPDSTDDDTPGGGHPAAIGPYRIIRELARGGMGVVFVAEDERLGRRVALKTLGAPAPGARDRLWREARAAAALNHPGICQVYDVEEVGEELWVTMELLEGEGLDAFLARERPDVDRAIEIALAILEPLGFLQERGMVHRDLKPSNAFLTPLGVKLLDFGLTRGFDSGDDPEPMADLTRTGAIVGTPRYMAPEQWRARDVGPQSDLFAWGAILYEMLAGRKAFEGDDPIDVYHAIAKEQPPPLTGTARIEALYQVVRGAIAKEPADRYGSTSEAADALRSAASRTDGEETTRTRRAVEARSSGTVQRFIALPFRMLRPDPETDFLATSLPEAIGTSLSGLKHLSVRSTQLGAGHANRLDLKRLAADIEVDYALSGTLLAAGPKVRVNAQLLEVPEGTVVWSMQEDAPVDDLFQLHDDLTRRIVDGVQVPLSPSEAARLARDAPVDPHAFELYLRGVHLVNGIRTESDLLAVRDLFGESVALDGSFAPAWAMYGRACRVIAKYVASESAEDHLERARSAFDRAFDVDPDSPIAHNFYTYYQLEELGDSRGGMLRLLERVAGGTADANLWAGLVPALRFLALFEQSVAAHDRAVSLDPGISTGVDLTRLQMGQYERVVETSDSPTIRAGALAAMGRDDEAIGLIEGGRDGEFEGVRQRFGRTLVAAVRGDVEEGGRRIEAARGQGVRDPEAAFFFGRAASHLGLLDLSVEMFTQAVDRGCFGIRPRDDDLWIQPVRSEPAFVALVERAGDARRDALESFRSAGGEALLGAAE